MFILEGKDSNYVIFGAQLEKYEQGTSIGLIDSIDTAGLINYSGLEQLIQGIQSSSEVLETVSASRTIPYSEDPVFIIDGKGGGKYEGYKTFIVARKKGEVRFLEIVLWRAPAKLRSRERKEIYQRLRIS